MNASSSAHAPSPARTPATPLPPVVTVQGIFDLTIAYFRPLGGMIPISAKLAMPPEFIPPAPYDKVFRTNGKNITVNMQGIPSSTRLELCFRLPSADHLLIGIAFASDVPTYDGQVEFPVSRIETVTVPGFPSLKLRQLIVTDDHNIERNKINYDYVIIIQSTSTGEIGIIDPDIETEGTE